MQSASSVMKPLAHCIRVLDTVNPNPKAVRGFQRMPQFLTLIRHTNDREKEKAEKSYYNQSNQQKVKARHVIAIIVLLEFLII
jgi:hypothetical protein